MGIGVHGYANLRMAHQILQGLGIHTTSGLLATVSMTAHMRGDFRKFFLINLIILLNCVLKIFLPMHSNHGAVILVKAQETRIAINYRLNHRRFSACQDSLEAGMHLILHGQRSGSRIGLGGCDVLGAVGLPLELMVNSDGPVPHVQVTNRQANKLGDSQTSMEQDVHSIVILTVVLVLFHKVQKLPHLFNGDGLSCNRVIHNNLGQFKVKGVLADVVIFHGHCKSGPKNATDAVDTAVTSSVFLLKLNQEQLRIGVPNLLDGQVGKGFQEYRKWGFFKIS